MSTDPDTTPFGHTFDWLVQKILFAVQFAPNLESREDYHVDSCLGRAFLLIHIVSVDSNVSGT
jgi:hypothetical protein